MSISRTIFNLWRVYHAMLELRGFLFQKGISCYSGLMVVHSSGISFYSGKEDREEMGEEAE